MTIAQLQNRAVQYLRAQQLTDGSFMAYASPQAKPFAHSRQQPTMFPTMLILDALHDVPSARYICDRAAVALQAEQSPQGSWNYWRLQSPAHQAEPYPDDLDDTACAVAALLRHDPAYASGDRLGSLARLLIAGERATGGPYNTWLIDHRAKPDWQDIDPAVNANINYALSLLGVRPAGLQQYLDKLITAGDYRSSYYIGVQPLLYFLARGYSGPASRYLRQAIVDAISTAPAEPLALALLLSAGCLTGLKRCELSHLADRLHDLFVNDHWLATPLYVDPMYNGQLHYNGSDALTTALALEALRAYQRSAAVSTPKPLIASDGLPRLTLARGYLKTITDNDLRHGYRTALSNIVTSNNGKQIAAAATLIAASSGWAVPAASLNQLNLASLNGWLAYTIYDDFLDGEGRPEQLSIANLSLRRSYDHFLQALPGNQVFRQLVITAFDGMDSANAWELKHARAIVTNGVMRLPALPTYGALGQLAQRSWGHSLAASGVLLSAYQTAQNPHFDHLQTFFKHFLIARQLNDDAHDWQDDLSAGRLSVVVGWLLADAGISRQLVLSQDIASLRHCFWATTIEQVVRVMQQHIATARAALEDLRPDYHDVSVLHGWLDSLAQSATLAISGRDDTVRFLQAYSGDQ